MIDVSMASSAIARACSGESISSISASALSCRIRILSHNEKLLVLNKTEQIYLKKKEECARKSLCTLNVTAVTGLLNIELTLTSVDLFDPRLASVSVLSRFSLFSGVSVAGSSGGSCFI